MRVTRLKLQTFMLKIARTREEEATCEDCAKLSAQLVEVVLTGAATNAELESILQHLKQCIPCSEEFEVLLNCAHMDAQESWPGMDELWAKFD
jgi:hypothetical protein